MHSKEDHLRQENIGRVSLTIAAPRATVWRGLVDPDTIMRYVFATSVESDWRVGSPIVWRNVERKAYGATGTILRFEPERVFAYTLFSRLSGLPDAPENYHRVTIELADDGAGTRVSVEQDNNASKEELEHAEGSWRLMLNGLKALLEGAR